MGHARTQHPNASLTPLGRRKVIDCVIDRGWTIDATAERFQVDAKTVRKWRDRIVTEGPSCLLDRSSRPHLSPNATPDTCRRRIIELRQQRRWGAAHIGFEVGRASSTVQKILAAEGLGQLDSGDRVTNDPVVRYQRDQTNGKIERFHRILLEELAYIRDWHTEHERTVEYDHFIHFYNHHRAHDALGWSTPIDTLEDNVPVMHK